MLAVVIPAYNRPDQLRECLDSLVNQTKKNFFTIVVDDCGEVDLSEVCDEYLDKLHIRYFRMEKNGGPGMARQYGLEVCYRSNIDYVIFLDSDDMLMPNTVKKLSYEITRKFDDIVFSAISVEQKNNADQIIPPKNNARIWLHGKIFRTKFLQENDIRFEEGLRGNEDICFLIKCLGLTNKVKYLNDALYLWRDEKSSLTRAQGPALDGILSLDYITAVCKGVLFLARKGIDVFKHTAYGFHCYGYYQMALKKGYEIPEEINQLLRDFFKIEEVKKALEKPSSWEELAKSIHQFRVVNKKIYIFPQSFFEWLDMLGVEYDKSNFG